MSAPAMRADSPSDYPKPLEDLYGDLTSEMDAYINGPAKALYDQAAGLFARTAGTELEARVTTIIERIEQYWENLDFIKSEFDNVHTPTVEKACERIASSREHQTLVEAGKMFPVAYSFDEVRYDEKLKALGSMHEDLVDYGNLKGKYHELVTELAAVKALIDS
jgi:hypothetical protein